MPAAAGGVLRSDQIGSDGGGLISYDHRTTVGPLRGLATFVTDDDPQSPGTLQDLDAVPTAPSAAPSVAPPTRSPSAPWGAGYLSGTFSLSGYLVVDELTSISRGAIVAALTRLFDADRVVVSVREGATLAGGLVVHYTARFASLADAERSSARSSAPFVEYMLVAAGLPRDKVGRVVCGTVRVISASECGAAALDCSSSTLASRAATILKRIAARSAASVAAAAAADSNADDGVDVGALLAEVPPSLLIRSKGNHNNHGGPQVEEEEEDVDEEEGGVSDVVVVDDNKASFGSVDGALELRGDWSESDVSAALRLAPALGEKLADYVGIMNSSRVRVAVLAHAGVLIGDGRGTRDSAWMSVSYAIEVRSASEAGQVSGVLIAAADNSAPLVATLSEAVPGVSVVRVRQATHIVMNVKAARGTPRARDQASHSGRKGMAAARAKAAGERERGERGRGNATSTTLSSRQQEPAPLTVRATTAAPPPPRVYVPPTAVWTSSGTSPGTAAASSPDLHHQTAKIFAPLRSLSQLQAQAQSQSSSVRSASVKSSTSQSAASGGAAAAAAPMSAAAAATATAADPSFDTAKLQLELTALRVGGVIGIASDALIRPVGTVCSKSAPAYTSSSFSIKCSNPEHRIATIVFASYGGAIGVCGSYGRGFCHLNGTRAKGEIILLNSI